MTGRKSRTVEIGSVPVTAGAKAAVPRNARRLVFRGLEVTPEDIAGAVRSNSHSCMIAEAIKRQVPGAKSVMVDVQSIRFTDTKHRRRVSFLTPRECQRGLVQFDQGVPVTPFKFDLRSIQVTALREYELVRDADGNLVKEVVVRERKMADGSTKVVSEKRTKRRVVSYASGKKTFSNNRNGAPSGDHIVGGRMPPVQKPSYMRKYGMKGFTWDDEKVVHVE